MSEQENTQLVVLDDSTLPIFFDESEDARAKAKAIIDAAEKHVMSEVCDVTTKEGRTREGSLARQISSMKVAIDDYGKNQIDDLNRKLKAFNAVRKDLRDRLDEIRDNRKSASKEWEEKEAARQEKIRDAIRNIEEFSEPVGAQNPLPQRLVILEHRLSSLNAIDTDTDFWEEFWETAVSKRKAGIESVSAQLAEVKTLIEQAEKLAKLEAEAEARRKADEEERLRKEGEERAKREFEAEQERKRLEEEHAKQGEPEPVIRHGPAHLIMDAESPSEPAQIIEEPLPQKSKAEINTAALNALVEHAGLTRDEAKAVVVAIVRNQIPNVSIQY